MFELWPAAGKERHRQQAREWKSKNAAKVKAARKAYYAANKERELAEAKARREADPIKTKRDKQSYEKKYRKKHAAALAAKRKTPEHRARLNANARRRYTTDIVYAVKCRLRASFVQALRLAGVRKTQSVMPLIGCSPQQLKDYLESLFLPGMTWDRRNEIHIDHVRPCSSFDLSKPEEQRACFHYTNLQPLWATDNQRKSNRWSPTLD